MKNRFTFLLFLIAATFASAQNTSNVADGFEVKQSKLPLEETFDAAEGIYNGTFYTLSTRMVRRFDLQTMEEIWRVTIDEKWSFNGLEFSQKKALLLADGRVLILGVYFNKKQSKAEIYGRLIDADGKDVETRKLTSLYAPKEKEINIEFFYANKHVVIYALSNLTSFESRMLQVAWLDQNLADVKKQNVQLGGPQTIENTFYDAPRNCLYITTKHQITGSNGVNVKSNFLIKCDINKLVPKVQDIDFEDFTGYLNAVAVDTTTGQPYLFGMAGPKKSNSMNSTFAIKIDPETLENQQTVFYPIYKDVVEKIAGDDKSKATVSLNFATALFVDKKIFVVFNNNQMAYCFGQYVVEHSKNFKDVSQHYSANLSTEWPIFSADEKGNLRMFSLQPLQYFNKIYPNLTDVPIAKDNKEVALFECTLRGNEFFYRTILVFKSDKEVKGIFLNAVNLINGKLNLLGTVGDFDYTKTSFYRASEL